MVRGYWFLLYTHRSDCLKFVGVDLSSEQLQFGRSRLQGTKVELRCANAYDLPYDDESFTTVVLCEILEHLKDPAKAVKEALRVLELGGRVITSVPADEVRRSKGHCRVFSSVRQLQDLFGLCVKWQGAKRLHRWYFAWGDKR